jgi:predicted peptidase
MTIILFGGGGQSEKLTKVEYKDNKYIKNNFINRLKKITNVIIPDIKYKHIYYYQKNDIYGQTKFFNPIKTLALDDLSIEKTIENLDIDKRRKYIVMGISDGIYFAMEFAKQYPKLVKEIISLDGSWITVKLCRQRLTNWKKKGKKVSLIKSQKQLDLIMNKIIKEKDWNESRKILDYKRYEHTKKCISKKYQNIIKNIKFTIFRDYNSEIKDEIDKQFNEYALLENKILSKLSKKYQIFWQIDASHTLWSKKKYKKQILDYIKYQL